MLETYEEYKNCSDEQIKFVEHLISECNSERYNDFKLPKPEDDERNYIVWLQLNIILEAFTKNRSIEPVEKFRIQMKQAFDIAIKFSNILPRFTCFATESYDSRMNHMNYVNTKNNLPVKLIRYVGEDNDEMSCQYFSNLVYANYSDEYSIKEIYDFILLYAQAEVKLDWINGPLITSLLLIALVEAISVVYPPKSKAGKSALLKKHEFSSMLWYNAKIIVRNGFFPLIAIVLFMNSYFIIGAICTCLAISETASYIKFSIIRRKYTKTFSEIVKLIEWTSSGYVDINTITMQIKSMHRNNLYRFGPLISFLKSLGKFSDSICMYNRVTFGVRKYRDSEEP